MDFRTREPAGRRTERSNGATRAVVQVCLLFRPGTAAPPLRGRAVRAADEASAPRDERRPIVTKRADAFENAQIGLPGQPEKTKPRMRLSGQNCQPQRINARFTPGSAAGAFNQTAWGRMEESSMVSNLVPRGALAALAGAALTVPRRPVHPRPSPCPRRRSPRRSPARRSARLVGSLGPLASQSPLGLAAVGLGAAEALRLLRLLRARPPLLGRPVGRRSLPLGLSAATARAPRRSRLSPPSSPRARRRPRSSR